MIKKYSEFLVENIQKAKSIYKQKLEDYEAIKDKLEKANRAGWMGKFTELLFSGTPKKELEDLFNTLEDLKKKNININIDTFKDHESILDEIAKKESESKMKSILNRFPKKQKEFILGEFPKYRALYQKKELELALIKLGEMENKAVFLNKIASYDTANALVSNLKRFISSSKIIFTREYIKSMLDKDLILTYEDERFLIVQTKTHASIQKIGSDTSWCIVRSAQQFKNYTNNGQTQFVLIDYEKESYETNYKIGFTLNNTGKIIYAHDVLDSSIVSYTRELLDKFNIKTDDFIKIYRVDFEELEKMKWVELRKTLEKGLFKPSLENISKVINLVVDKKPGKTVLPYYFFSDLFKSFLSTKKALTNTEFATIKKNIKDKKIAKEIERELLTKKLLLEENPKDPYDYALNLHYENYKNWTFSIDETNAFELVTELLKVSNPWDEQIIITDNKYKFSLITLHYLDMSDKENEGPETKLLRELCLIGVGEYKKDYNNSINEVEKLIQQIMSLNKDNGTFYFSKKLQYIYIIRNNLGIEYKFNDKHYDLLGYNSSLILNKLLINEPTVLTTLKDIDKKLKKIEDFDYSIILDEEEISDYFRLYTYANVKQLKPLTTKAEVNRDHFKFFFELLSPLLVNISNKIQFKKEVQLPIKMKKEITWLKNPKEVEITLVKEYN